MRELKQLLIAQLVIIIQFCLVKSLSLNTKISLKRVKQGDITRSVELNAY